MARSQPRRWLLLSVWMTATIGGSPAMAQNLDRWGRELIDIEASAAHLRSRPMRVQKLRSATYVEERLADGELFYRLKDYLRASVIFTDIVEHYEGHRAYPDALMLLGESLYSAGDTYGARTRFRQILEHAEQQAYQPYVQRALGRLIDIALKTRDFRGVEEYFDKLNRIPPSKVEAATVYAKAKYLYSRAVDPELSASEGDEFNPSSVIQNEAELGRSEAAFRAIGAKSAYRAQADYFLGVILSLKQNYPEALKAFRRVVQQRRGTGELEAIRQLAYLALGRLYYETLKLASAVKAYQSVPRTSVYFDTALYEIAWVYIRQGDSVRAERSLDVLALAAPLSRYIPDAKLLRGNLLLRNGNFKAANQAFNDVIRVVKPVNKQLAAVLARHDDLRTYFRGLVGDNIDTFSLETFIPEKALLWAPPDANMKRAMRVIADFGDASQALKETEQLVQRLDGALRAENSANIFADLRLLGEQSVLLHNRLYIARSRVAAVDDRSRPGHAELQSVRSERRRLEGLLKAIPQSQEALDARERDARRQHSALRRELRELEVEVSGLRARLAALETITKGTPKTLEHGADGSVDMARELEHHETAVASYEQRIGELRLAIEQAQLRVGIDDERYQYDEANRNAYRSLVKRERELLSAARLSRNPQVDVLLAKAERVEKTLDAYDATLKKAAQDRAQDMLSKVAEEVLKLEDYHTQIAQLGSDSEEAVGDVAFGAFQHLQTRFHDLVLRADVGKVDLVWAIREEHRLRVEALTTARAREIQTLDDEFREIMDEQDGSSADQEQTP